MTEQAVQPNPAAEAPPSGRTATGARPESPPPRQRFDPREKSPGFAAFLSVIPGMGQLYIGYYARGACICFSMLALFVAVDVVRPTAEPLFVFSALFVWAFGIIDAGRMAALYNHAMAGAEIIELPRDFEMPSTGGSIGGGALLLVLGLIALSNTALGFSLAWLESWWPLLPVGIGAYLLVRGYMDSAR